MAQDPKTVTVGQAAGRLIEALDADPQGRLFADTPAEVVASMQVRIEGARAVMQSFVRDGAMKKQYGQEGSWKTFESAAEGRFLTDLKPETCISMMCRLIDGMAARLVPNVATSLPREVAADHWKFERRKAGHKKALYMAALDLAQARPGETPKVMHDRLRFRDEVRKAQTWEESIRQGRSRRGASPVQQKLF